MALSFEESKQQLIQQNETVARPMIMKARVMATESGWTRVTDPKYAWFDEFTDDKISYVDENKDITIDNSQINISQESKSQFIPFEMPRYYDGIDLTKMAISIHFTNSDKQHAASPAVNVQYNNDKIRFAWLVDANATHIDGNLQFEIHADGTISDNTGKSYGYRWRSKPTDKFNIVKSLCQDPNCEPIYVSDDWVQEIVQNVATAVAEEIKNIQVDLSNYYTKTEVNEKIANVDVDLTGYATETYVQEQIDAIPEPDLSDYALKTDIPTNVSDFTNDAGYITRIPDEYITEAELESKGYLTDHQDLSAYALKTEIPSIEGLATEKYVNDAVGKVDVSGQLVDYAKSADVYTKTEVDNKTNALSSSISTNATNISSLSNTVEGLQSTVNSIDTSPRKTYDVAYNDTEDPDVGENVFVFYEITNEDQSGGSREIKKKFTIVGGSGGGTTSTLKIEYVTTSPVIVTVNDKVIIKYRFSGKDSSGDPVSDGVATWKIGKQIISTGTAISGENTFDATDYIGIGTQKLTLSITDDAGSLVTKTWTVQKIDIRLESSFNDKLTYNMGAVSFDYTPYGAISKDIHFKLDGVELGRVTTSSSGIPMSYSIPAQTHGAHLLETYITAEINGSTIESNHILKDIIWYNPESEDAVIGCIQNTITVQQYDTENIVYTVYDPKTETPTVTLAIDNKEVSTLQLDSNTQIWQYKPTDVGTHVLTITCRDTVKTINVTVEKLDIDVTPVTAGLQFDFNPVGRSNNDTNRLWSYSENADIKMTVSDNFDWENGGYQIDENGDQYFGIKAGTSATISYNLFADDARRNGKEFKLIFKTDNVSKSDATFLTCQSANIGLQMNVHEAYIKSSAKSLYVPYSEGDIIEWEFNIAKDTDIPIVMSYEDGTPCRPMSYTSDHSFTQETPVPITIGSPDCDVLIYRMKAYNTSLSSEAILSNFIADARTATEIVARYRRNQIYDENNALTPESVAEACPNIRVIKIEAPYFTNNKKDFVKNTSVECIYKNGDAVLDNWKFINMYHSGQGTTSNEYGASGRNIDIIGGFDGKHQVTSKVELDPNYITELTLGDGTKVSDGSGKVSLTRNSVPNSWFNIKVNIASSEMVNNAYLQKRYNDYLPYSTPATRRDPRIKNDMEFVNCVVFIKESNPDLTTHREFQDTDWHYYALGNIGDSKKTDITRAYDPDDMKEFCVEISDNTLANSIFQTGVKNADGSMKYPITKAEWVPGNKAYDALYNDWDGSYEFRYDCCGDSKDGEAISTDEAKEQIRTQNKQIWRDFYEFVITSSDSEFVSNLKNWFIVDSALYWYLFTTRYTMIDNRAKNSFWHYAKHYISTSEAATLGDKASYYTIDDDAAAINNGYRFDLWDYDNDRNLSL